MKKQLLMLTFIASILSMNNTYSMEFLSKNASFLNKITTVTLGAYITAIGANLLLNGIEGIYATTKLNKSLQAEFTPYSRRNHTSPTPGTYRDNTTPSVTISFCNNANDGDTQGYPHSIPIGNRHMLTNNLEVEYHRSPNPQATIHYADGTQTTVSNNDKFPYLTPRQKKKRIAAAALSFAFGAAQTCLGIYSLHSLLKKW